MLLRILPRINERFKIRRFNPPLANLNGLDLFLGDQIADPLLGEAEFLGHITNGQILFNVIHKTTLVDLNDVFWGNPF